MAINTLFQTGRKPRINRFSGRLKTALSAGLLACSLAPVMAQNAALDETTAIRLGLQRPAVSDLLNGRLDAARGSMQASGRWLNPQFQYTREGVDGLGGNGTENFFSLSQTIDFSGQRGLEREAAESRLSARRFETREYRHELTAEIRGYFFNVLRWSRLEQAAADWLSQIDRLHAIIAKREAAGEASRYDRRRITQERAAGPALLAEIRAERDAAREHLAALIGPEQLQQYSGLTGTVLPPSPAPLEQIVQSQQQRPGLRMLEEQAEAFTLERRAAQRRSIPDVTVSLGVRTIQNNMTGNDTGLLLSASVPLPLFNRYQGNTLQADGQARATRAEYLIQLRRARARVAATRHRLVTLRETAMQYRDEAAAPAAELKDIAEAAYEAGEVGILELLDAYENAFEVQRRALELEIQARQAQIELDRLTGEESP